VVITVVVYADDVDADDAIIISINKLIRHGNNS
jgi:hypothetical protein